MGPMYGPTGGPQRVPQHPNYGPGPQQGHMRPPQGLKRPYNSEVRDLICAELTALLSRDPSLTCGSLFSLSQGCPSSTASPWPLAEM